MKQQPATSMTNNQSLPHHLAAAGVQLSQQQQHLQHQRHLPQQQPSPHQPQAQQSQQIQHQQQLHSQQQQLAQQQMHQHQLNQSQQQQQHSHPQPQFQHHQNQQQQQLHQRQPHPHLQEPHQHVQSQPAGCHSQQQLAANMQQSPQQTPTPTNQLLKKELPANGKKTKGRVRIKMEFIHNKLRRYTTFSKRKTGIMKKAFELATLTGTQVMLLVASETGHVYTFATKKLQPMIISEAGKALIQTCLNSPDSDNLLMSAGSNGPISTGPASAVSQASPSASSSASSGPSTPGSSGSPQHHAHQQQQPPVQQSQQVTTASSMSNQRSFTLASSSPIQYQTARGGQCASSAQVQSRHNLMLATSSDQSQQQQMMQPTHSRTSSAAGQQQVPTSSANQPTTDQRMSATGFEETELSYSINDDLNDRSTFDTYSSALAALIGGDQEQQTSQLISTQAKLANQDNQNANSYRKMIEPHQQVTNSVSRAHQFSNNPLYVGSQTFAAISQADQQQFQLNLSSSASTRPTEADSESALADDMSSSYQYTSVIQQTSGESQLPQMATSSQRVAKGATCACVHHQQDQQNLFSPSNRSASRQQAVKSSLIGVEAGSTTRNFNSGTTLEECNGALFMEYQTCRSQLGGCLEELQSLNVNQCDSDALEEHMNLLSGDDCFSNQYELQDFGSDNFLNMLCLNNNSTTNGAPQSQLATCTLITTGTGNQPAADQLLSSTPSLVTESSESSITEPPSQLLVRCSHLLNGSTSNGSSSIASSCTNNSSCSNSSNSNSSSTSSTPASKRVTVRKSKSAGSKQAPQMSSLEQQNKITTTNTNRSLLPKRSSLATPVHQTQCVNSMARVTGTLRLNEQLEKSPNSNNSTRNSSRITLIPGESNCTGAATLSEPIQIPGATSSVCTAHNGSEWPDTAYRQQLENLRKKLKMDIEPESGDRVGLESTVRPLKEANSQPSVSVCSQPLTCKPNGATTYLIARPLMDGLESSGRTIYLRTPNGLVPISAASHSRTRDGNG